jgi:pyochelin biosynthetic protein PchC
MSAPDRPGTWLRTFHPRPGAAARVIVFPPAGGAATFAVPLSAALGPDVEVLAVQYPGRQDRLGEPSPHDLGELADRLAGVIAGLPELPTVLFGHSMGAAVAFEVAHRLQGRWSPEAVIVSARESPRSVPAERLHGLPDDRLVLALGRLGAEGMELLADPELRDLLLPVLRSDLRAAETYRHPDAEPLECPLLALAGVDDPAVQLPEAGRWREATTQFLGLEAHPGGHFYLQGREPEIAARLRALLDGVRSGLLP